MDPAQRTPSSEQEEFNAADVLLVANPDGTLAAGVPSAVKDMIPKAPVDRPVRVGVSLFSEEEFLRLYERNLLLFSLFALLLMTCEAVYLVTRYLGREAEIARIHDQYPTFGMPESRKIFLAVLGLEGAYALTAATFAVMAWSTGRPRHFQSCGDACAAGALGHVALASGHVVKLHVALLLLRLAGWGYSRFLRYLGKILSLHNPPALPGA
mmetsp:Transcript_56624/g.124158  ORF Transcript_56624/g.124158 Transcript_56624/m.124158 type:complete len:211 (-) Transcript_56624:201-833(-)|eukprot:CAMPEP_0204264854 /NCGR_PEP_ID=MMETSP0468-20130131/9285_1 /ASSEMBLY_ACC=CAM_ASM_000383 /TAXON_ID=2969 /ORGANISM="Oxyrrhis marina" /LENGTH=210 /DNA_ID=CAMNT_0051239753 /DNA_START=63 /DNA_END=695 /DNA_ORIENTATION=-